MEDTQMKTWKKFCETADIINLVEECEQLTAGLFH